MQNINILQQENRCRAQGDVFKVLTSQKRKTFLIWPTSRGCGRVWDRRCPWNYVLWGTSQVAGCFFIVDIHYASLALTIAMYWPYIRRLESLSTFAHAWTGLIRQIEHLYRYSNHHRWAIRKSNAYAQIRPFLKLRNSQLALKSKQNIRDQPNPQHVVLMMSKSVLACVKPALPKNNSPLHPGWNHSTRTPSTNCVGRCGLEITLQRILGFIGCVSQETWFCVLLCFQKFQTCFFLGRFGDLNKYINSRKINVDQRPVNPKPWNVHVLVMVLCLGMRVQWDTCLPAHINKISDLWNLLIFWYVCPLLHRPWIRHTWHTSHFRCLVSVIYSMQVVQKHVPVYCLFAIEWHFGRIWGPATISSACWATKAFCRGQQMQGTAMDRMGSLFGWFFWMFHSMATTQDHRQTTWTLRCGCIIGNYGEFLSFGTSWHSVWFALFFVQKDLLCMVDFGKLLAFGTYTDCSRLHLTKRFEDVRRE